MTKYLDLLSGTGATTAVLAFIDNVSTILTCLAALTAIITGIISIILKIKSATKDGVIDDTEKEDIKNEAEALSKTMSDTADKLKNN